MLAIADIAARRPGSTTAPPAAPEKVRCSLATDGVNSVTWAGSTSRMSFSVQRQLTDAEGTVTAWTAFGGAMTRPFLDDSVPAGTVAASYRVQALRTGLRSAWSEPGTLQLVPLQSAPASLKIAA